MKKLNLNKIMKIFEFILKISWKENEIRKDGENFKYIKISLDKYWEKFYPDNTNILERNKY